MELLEQIEERYIETNGIKLHTVLIGEGEPIIMLHGFPDFWYGWKKIIIGLKEEYKLIVPDTRGINLSDKPQGVENYKVRVLAEDIRGLVKALHLDKFILVGHDWGTAISFAYAELYPESLKKLIILNGPHPKMVHTSAGTSEEQKKASSYVEVFKRPDAVALFTKDDFRGLRASGVFRNKSDFDKDKYREAYSQPGALDCGFNYYRANDPKPGEISDDNDWTGYINVPTMVIWGMKDPYLKSIVLNAMESYISNLKIVQSPEATHWVMDDDPELIISSIQNFIKN